MLRQLNSIPSCLLKKVCLQSNGDKRLWNSLLIDNCYLSNFIFALIISIPYVLVFYCCYITNYHKHCGLKKNKLSQFLYVRTLGTARLDFLLRVLGLNPCAIGEFCPEHPPRFYRLSAVCQGPRQLSLVLRTRVKDRKIEESKSKQI